MKSSKNPHSLKSLPKIPYQVRINSLFDFLCTIIYLVELSHGDTIYLKSFPSNRIQEFINFAKEILLIDKSTEHIHATGGGAYKYHDLFEREFGPLGI
jgi:pantothenate kinase